MQQIFEFPIAPSCTFENFIECDGNSAALCFARRITDPAEPERLLYLYGPSGSGKTHLLKAIGLKTASGVTPGAPYFSCRENMSVEALIGAFSDAKALVVDDLHLLPDLQEIRAALWQLFNDYYIAGYPVALAGLHPPRMLPHLDDHLVSRLLWGLVARVDVSDDSSRRMIIKKIADDLQVRVPDDVVDYILTTTSREVGELVHFFQMVYRYSLATQRRITLSLAREARGQIFSGGS